MAALERLTDQDHPYGEQDAADGADIHRLFLSRHDHRPGKDLAAILDDVRDDVFDFVFDENVVACGER